MSPDHSAPAHKPADASSPIEGAELTELTPAAPASADAPLAAEPSQSIPASDEVAGPAAPVEGAAKGGEQAAQSQPELEESTQPDQPQVSEILPVVGEAAPAASVVVVPKAVQAAATDSPTVGPTAAPGPSAASPAPAAAGASPTPPVAPLAPPPAAPREVVSGKPLVLPNGKVGEAYSYAFTKEVIDLSGCLNVRVLAPDGLGLTFDQPSQTLAGRPTQAGEHTLRLSYQPAAATPADPTLVRLLQWYVNPDPRSLWTEHEPSAELTGRKPHVAHQLLAAGPKVLAAASRRGRSHAKDAKFREDDFRCYYQADSQAYVVAVADGAGSASMSREGSRLACELATQHLISALSGGIADKLRGFATTLEAAADRAEVRKTLQDELYKLLGNAALIAARHITQTAEAAGHVVRDYATTLLLTLCLPTAQGWLVGAFWVGDGGLGLYRREEGIRLLGKPDGGEYSGQTRFLTMKETFEASSLYGRVRFELVPDFDALVLMTDGITDALFQTDANLANAEKWQELLDGINAAAPLRRDNQAVAAQLAEWLNFWVKGEYDDRTIAILF